MPINPYVTKEKYLREATNVEIVVNFAGKHEQDLNGKFPTFDQEDLFTEYNGICKVIRINETFPIRTYQSFKIMTKVPMTIFYLQGTVKLSYPDKLSQECKFFSDIPGLTKGS